MKKKKLIIISAAVFVALSSFTGGYFLSQARIEAANQKDAETYSLLAKRLFIENPNDVQFDFRGLKASLEEDLYSGLGYENSERVTVYFEYLPTGMRVEINPELEVASASLLKTPIAMTVYKLVERGQISLDDTLDITQEHIDPSYGELYKEGVGATFTVKEYIEFMLQNSDNTAANVLKWEIGEKIDLIDTLSALGIQIDIEGDRRFFISSSSYGRIFKCLYLACYNSRQHSQEILNMLSNTNFHDRMTKLLPDDVVVAHKFGTSGKLNTSYQSDCGIVYANSGNSNYILCVMARGSDVDASEEIARISYRVHSYVKSLKGE